MTSVFETYPELKRLHDWAADRSLSVTIEATDADMISVDARILKIESPGKPAIKLTVFDEYNDARQDNLLLCLCLIAMEFGELGDAADARSWARANSLDERSDQIDDAHLAGVSARAAFVETYGKIPDTISDYDWSLNAGAAQALRAATTRR